MLTGVFALQLISIIIEPDPTAPRPSQIDDLARSRHALLIKAENAFGVTLLDRGTAHSVLFPAGRADQMYVLLLSWDGPDHTMIMYERGKHDSAKRIEKVFLRDVVIKQEYIPGRQPTFDPDYTVESGRGTVSLSWLLKSGGLKPSRKMGQRARAIFERKQGLVQYKYGGYIPLGETLNIWTWLDGKCAYEEYYVEDDWVKDGSGGYIRDPRNRLTATSNAERNFLTKRRNSRLK